MEVEFQDKRLALIETDRAAETKLPISVINACRQKLVVIRAAPDVRTLRNWKSLHYEKLRGERSGQRSIRINRQWLPAQFENHRPRANPLERQGLQLHGIPPNPRAACGSLHRRRGRMQRDLYQAPVGMATCRICGGRSHAEMRLVRRCVVRDFDRTGRIW